MNITYQVHVKVSDTVNHHLNESVISYHQSTLVLYIIGISIF